MLNLKEVLQFLRDEGYLTDCGELNDKFRLDVAAAVYGPKDQQEYRQLAVHTPQQLEIFQPPSDWTMYFLNFIMEAKVPKQILGPRGDPYYVNKFSEPALKVFRKALEKEGVIYDILVKSTTLYYASSVGLKKAIGNYFIQGDWRSDYESLLQAVRSGPEELTEHIKTELNDVDTRSNYSLG